MKGVIIILFAFLAVNANVVAQKQDAENITLEMEF